MKAELIPLMEVTGVLEVSLALVPQLRLFLLTGRLGLTILLSAAAEWGIERALSLWGL